MMQTKRKTLLYLALFAATLSAQNFNPILPDNVADPSISKFGDTFYLYGTTDIDQGLDKMGIPVVWKSKDFVNWSFEGTIMEGIDWCNPYSFTDSDGKEKSGYFRYWAPGVALERDGKYYLFTTIVKPEGSDYTYLLVADRPEGPFRFVEGEGLFAPELAHKDAKPVVYDIDGDPFVDEDGSAYLYWRRRKATKLSANWTEPEGAEVTINTKRNGYSEGPVMFKRAGIYYYIYTLSGHQNYMNAYMMSKEGPLTNFYAPAGNDVFLFSSIAEDVWGPGHGNVYHDKAQDAYYFAYLEYSEGGTTRQVFVNKMEFNADGTIKTMRPDRKGVGYLGKNQEQRVNLALGSTVTASSAKSEKLVEVKIESEPNQPKPNKESVKDASRNFTYEAANAVDGYNGTRWMADENDRTPWLMIDLGKKVNLTECQLAFAHPAQGHAWELQKSNDGVNWEVCARQSERVARSPHIAQSIGKTRYLRVLIQEGSAGLWQVKVYGK